MRRGSLSRRVPRLLALFAAAAVTAVPAAETIDPIDPWDYSYCGGQPVYPVIGYTFATLCGPRNQIALGRRGHLMWSFPSLHDPASGQRGTRLLGTEELKRLSLLAEVAHLADSPPAGPGTVVYNLGIDFQGRPYKRVHAPLGDQYAPAHVLFRAMLASVPDAPQLPACDGALRDFNPTLMPAERLSANSPVGKTDHEKN